MNKNIPEVLECSKCKAYKSEKDMFRKRKKPNLFELIKGDAIYVYICKECVNNE